MSCRAQQRQTAYPCAYAGELRHGQSAKRETLQAESRIAQEMPKSVIKRFGKPLLAISIVRMPGECVGITEAGHVRHPHAESGGKRLDVPRPVDP
nr:hypothetical protein [Acidovorax delafieldii]